MRRDPESSVRRPPELPAAVQHAPAMHWHRNSYARRRLRYSILLSVLVCVGFLVVCNGGWFWHPIEFMLVNTDVPPWTRWASATAMALVLASNFIRGHRWEHLAAAFLGIGGLVATWIWFQQQTQFQQPFWATSIPFLALSVAKIAHAISRFQD